MQSFPAHRCLEAAGSQAAADAAVAPDQNLSGLSVVGEGVFAFEGHRLDFWENRKSNKYATLHTGSECQ